MDVLSLLQSIAGLMMVSRIVMVSVRTQHCNCLKTFHCIQRMERGKSEVT